MDPRDLWVKAEYQMCHNGRVRAGPAHPTMGNGGVVGSNPWDRPCRNGAPQIFNADGNEWRGWKMNGWDDKEGAKWDYTTDTAFDGAYYFYRGTVKIGPNPSNWDIMIVTESKNGVGNRVGGDIEISGNPKFYPYYSDNDVVMFAERDLIISGNPEPEGIFVTKEQLKISGNPEVYGAFIVHDENDTSDSNVHFSEISGNPIITYDGAGTTEWVGSGSGAAEFTILRRTER